jgi:glyoxylase-like metal-dependent hydrolase (beta-lactamase superfamily II)
MSDWLEVGDRVFTRRYRFFDQQIGVVLGDDGVLLVDTRSTHRQAEELRADLRRLTPLPVRLVVNTHLHFDHCFGNRPFRPAVIWGHERCASGLTRTGELQRAEAVRQVPELAEELAEVVIEPPDRTFSDLVEVDAGGRQIELRHLGRGHTDNDIIVRVVDAGVLFAGDLVEQGAPPSFGDAFPLDWPGSVEALLGLVGGPVVPGHGEVVDRSFVESQLDELRTIVALGRRIHAGELSLDSAAGAAPFPPGAALMPLERTLAQLRGDLDRGPQRPDAATRAE